MVTLKTLNASLENARGDVVALLIFEEKELFSRQMKRLSRLLDLPLERLVSGAFTGKEHQTLPVFSGRIAARRLLLVGAGPAKDLTIEKLRRAGAAAARSAHEMKARRLAVMAPEPSALALASGELRRRDWERIGTALAEGCALSLYRFDKYISDARKNRTVRSVVIVSDDRGRLARLTRGVEYARIVCEATELARDLANAPGNEIFPETLAARAWAVGRQTAVRVTVFNQRTIHRLGMGGLEGVSQGSARPPRFIIMEYNRGAARRGTVVLVGKGVTFDAGGISLKPAKDMAEMKMDMSGAAAVIGTLQAVARLRLPLHVVGLIPATENLPGGSALKPGDILRHFNGVTSEIDNTDAEGRLILADALSYASKYDPDLVIDLATLTGACVVALGLVATGMMGNDQAGMEALRDAGNRTYERVWELPLFEEYEKLVKSDVADVKNVGGRWAGAITAAMFLKKFIGPYKWIHLDIAGTASSEQAQDYIPKGGSGVGVRLLTDFLRHWRKRP